MPIAAILLAAGSGRRFGGHKLLHPLADGTPVGVAAARRLLAAVPEVTAVLRPGDRELAAAFADLGLHVVANPDAALGMGRSLAVGVAASAGADGWLIGLADMPWVRPATLRALADALHGGASLVAPVHAGRRGHPVGFAGRWEARLLALDGERGGRDLLASHPEELLLLPTDDPGVVRDVDAPADLRPR